MNLIGDLAINGLYVIDPKNNPDRIKDMVSLFEDSLNNLANLECPVFVDNSKNIDKNWIHTSSEEATKEILTALKINCVSLANNHVYDCTMPGLKATINCLDELGILHTGAGWKTSHISPIILEEEEKKIAFMAYVDILTNPKTEKYSEELLINYLEEDRIIDDIKKVKSKVDKVIISLHWGVDYSYYPTPSQRKLAKKLINEGASIIMGHHPHTIQPFEKYNNGIIYYSLGGLTFGDYIKSNGKLGSLFKKTKKGVIANLEFTDNCINDKYEGSKELKGNYIIRTKFNFNQWSSMKWRWYRIGHKNKLFYKWMNFKEKILYRIYEYFFGYYQNPLKRLFQLKNLKKIRRLTKS